MDRFISVIIRKISNLLGIVCLGKRGVVGCAIQDSGLRSQLRSQVLRHGGGSSLAGLHVAVAHVRTANWRPAETARRASRR